MTNFNEQEIIGDEAIEILNSLLDAHFIDFNPFPKHDSTADIDGYIRLRDGVNKNENEFLLFQSKGTKELKDGKFYCSKELLDFLYSSTVPTILFVTDTTTRESYWYYPSEERKKAKKAEAGVTLDLSENKILPGSSDKLRAQWGVFARRTDFAEQSKQVKEIKDTLNKNVSNVIGLFFLLQRLEKPLVFKLLKEVLSIEEAESKVIISKLIEKGILTETERFYIVENDKIGEDSVHSLLDSVDLGEILSRVSKIDDEKIALERLVNLKHPKVEEYFKKTLSDIKTWLDTPTSNDKAFKILQRIEVFAHRYPKEVLELIEELIASAPIPPKVLHKFKDGDLLGKEKANLIQESVSILKQIRYVDTKSVVRILMRLSRDNDKATVSKSIEALKATTEYNLPVLKQIGVLAQQQIIEVLKGYTPEELIENKEAVVNICEELLDPSFEGRSWSDMTLTMTSGPLPGNQALAEIRDNTISILQELYKKVTSVEDKKRILVAMEHATTTPHHAGMSKELEEIIMKNVEALIDFYISLIEGGTENEIIHEIEERAYWFAEWYGKGRFKKLEQLNSLIANNTEYAMFKTFVGYDTHLTGDWKENKKTRSEQIEQFVADINETNFPEWKDKIVLVTKNYNPQNLGEYSYLNQFLYRLGKEKPGIALRLIAELEFKLDDFLIHLVAGVHASKNSESAKRLARTWVAEGRNLAVCAGMLGYENEPQKIDIPLFDLIFKKAKKNKDREALMCIARISFANFSKNRPLKNYFISSVKELSALGDTWWPYNIFYRNSDLLKYITAKDADTIIKALLPLKRIDYHSEDLLVPIAKKWPKKVIDFFFKRVKSKKNRKRVVGDYFDAIPHDFSHLDESLREKQEVVLPLLVSWFGIGKGYSKWLYAWEASHFIEKLFSKGFTPYLESLLIKLVKTKDSKKLKPVLSIIQKYHGDEKIWNICKEIAAQYHQHKEYEKIKGEMMAALSNAGVLVGENGLLLSYEAKLAEAEKVDDGGVLAIKQFKEEYIASLKARIEFEKRRVSENLALRKKGLF